MIAEGKRSRTNEPTVVPGVLRTVSSSRAAEIPILRNTPKETGPPTSTKHRIAKDPPSTSSNFPTSNIVSPTKLRPPTVGHEGSAGAAPATPSIVHEFTRMTKPMPMPMPISTEICACTIEPPVSRIPPATARNSYNQIDPDDNILVFSINLEALLINQFFNICYFILYIIVCSLRISFELLSPVFVFVWNLGARFYWYMVEDSFPQTQVGINEGQDVETELIGENKQTVEVMWDVSGVYHPWFWVLGLCWILFVVGMIRVVGLVVMWITFGDLFMCFLYALQ